MAKAKKKAEPFVLEARLKELVSKQNDPCIDYQCPTYNGLAVQVGENIVLYVGEESSRSFSIDVYHSDKRRRRAFANALVSSGARLVESPSLDDGVLVCAKVSGHRLLEKVVQAVFGTYQRYSPPDPSNI